VDTEAFMRDGYVPVRGAFGADTARACREMICDVLAERGVSPDDRATWTPPLVRIDCPEGAPFAAAGTSPRLHAAYDELVGAGRWVPRAGVGGTVPVRFPSEEHPEDIGYHIEGSYGGGQEWWANVRSRDRGLLALFLFSDVGPADAPTRLIVGSHLFVPPVLAPAGEDGMPGVGAVPARRRGHGPGRRRVPVPPVHRAHRNLAAPGQGAADDGPARGRRAGRLLPRRLRPVSGGPGDVRGLATVR
jgi:hypothetical protein